MNNLFLHSVKPDMLPVDSIYVSISDLTLYDNNSIDNIIVQDLFDYLYESEIPNILKIIHDKLSSDGRLHIQATDLKQLAIAIAFNDVAPELAKKVLYPHKKSIGLLPDIIKLLKDNRFTVESSHYTNIFEYYLVCSKNV